MPVFVLALTNPAFYLPAIIKTVTLGQQASSTNAHSAGRELVGSTVIGAWMAILVWCGLSLQPNLWMLMLWMVAAALWAGAKLFGVRCTSFPPSFWSNALVTMLILLGPAIEDAAVGKDVYRASATRVALFVAVSLYAWATVWVLERWRASRSKRLVFKRA
jgi:FtsH-binding integral membrane protein